MMGSPLVRVEKGWDKGVYALAPDDLGRTRPPPARGGYLRMAASMGSVPQPGLSGPIRWPSLYSGVWVKSSSSQASRSISVCIIREFGTEQAKWAFIIVQRWP